MASSKMRTKARGRLRKFLERGLRVLLWITVAVGNTIFVFALIALGSNTWESDQRVKLILPLTNNKWDINGTRVFMSNQSLSVADSNVLRPKGNVAEGTLRELQTRNNRASRSRYHLQKKIVNKNRSSRKRSANCSVECKDFKSCRYWCKTKANQSDRFQHINISTETILKTFRPFMTQEEKDQLEKVLEVFLQATEKIDLTCIMYGGTLLGSYRHHGMIPWDDDVDLICNASEKLTLKLALMRHNPGYTVWTYDVTRWKFFSKRGARIRGVAWNYPFIDISFFKENQTHIWDSDPGYRKDFKYLKRNVFPLARRPFWSRSLFAPRHTQVIVKKNYCPDTCTSPSYNHKREKKIRKQLRWDIPCRLLFNNYPFVFRQNVSGPSEKSFVDETLQIGGKVLTQVTVESVR